MMALEFTDDGRTYLSWFSRTCLYPKGRWRWAAADKMWRLTTPENICCPHPYSRSRCSCSPSFGHSSNQSTHHTRTDAKKFVI